MKIMNRFRLKITEAVVLTLAAIAGVYVFWPAKTKPITKSGDTRHSQKKEKRALQARPKITRREGVYLEGAQARKFRSRPPEWNQKQSHFADAETVPQFSDNLQTRQQSKSPGRYYERHPGIAGSEKVGEPPIWQPERFNVEDRARSLEFPKSIRPKRPIERSMPGPPEGAELKIPQEQLKQMNETALLHILEEYKDNPEQAEQVRKILLERLEHFNKQPDTNDIEASEKK